MGRTSVAPLAGIRPDTPPIACRKPLLDASARHLAPLAIAMLIAFGLAWSAFSAWLAADTWADFRAASRPPAGHTPPSTRASAAEVGLAIALFLAGPCMLYGAWRHARRLNHDASRRERLRRRGSRRPAASVRVIEEIVGGSRTRRREFRAIVAFDAPDGQRYEAASDRFPAGQPPAIDVDDLLVLFDDQDPLDSLVDESSPAIRRARSARPLASVRDPPPR